MLQGTFAARVSVSLARVFFHAFFQYLRGFLCVTLFSVCKSEMLVCIEKGLFLDSVVAEHFEGLLWSNRELFQVKYM